jgi:outer membrane protein OmpA-like peptidoglycan-associated protein
MKTFTIPTLALALVMAAAPGRAIAGTVEEDRRRIDGIAADTVQQFLDERPGDRALYDGAYGYAVFQSIKVVIGVSGGGGKGVAVNQQTSGRTYMKMGTAGIGLGLGGQKYRLLMLFRDADTFNDFVVNGWEGNASASAAAGKEGKNAKSSFEQGVEVYQFTRSGLLAKADISGTKFWHNNRLNVDTSRADSDGDGVIDVADACPGTPQGATVDARGCWVLSNVHFETSRSEITPEIDAALDEVAQVLQQNPDVRVRIDGHTDAAGSDAFNMQLSLRRASAVRDALIGRGIAADRLVARGFGETAPIVEPGPEQHARLNRRVEITAA